MIKNKFIIVILINFLTILSLISCDNYCDHVWIDASCNKPKICYKCGETIGDELGHRYIDGKCIICNEHDSNYIYSTINFAIQEKQTELKKYKDLILNNVDDTLKNNIKQLFIKAIDNLNNVNNISEIQEFSNQYLKDVYSLIPLANGELNFSTLSSLEKDKILFLLNEYIFRNNLSGIPISKNTTLNLNSTTKEQWIEFFGTNGSITKTEEDEYWENKLFLSNKNFIKGLILSLPKDDSSTDVFDYIQIDYETYEFYNYNLELARKYFNLAMEELYIKDTYSSQYPIELKLEIAFGIKTEKNQKLFNAFKDSIERAFNHQSVSKGKYVLNVEAWYGEYFGQIYKNKLYNGKFDLSFDKISGSVNNEYMLYYLLSSNPILSNNLTINWSINTNKIEDDCIVYNGYRFTYDSLLSLLSSKQNVIDGVIVNSQH